MCSDFSSNTIRYEFIIQYSLHGDRGIFIFSVQLTTSRIGNLTRLIHTLLYVMTIHTYIHIHGLLRVLDYYNEMARVYVLV